MRRVSTNMNHLDTQRNLRLQESRLNKATNQMGSQRRIHELRDDPVAAGHLVRYQSYLDRVQNFEKNALTLSDQFVMREGYMTGSLEIMQRVRELAVTGANGIYTPEDMRAIAMEADELLKELVQNANAISADGNAIFAGTNTKSVAFEVEMGTVEGSGIPLISNVRYKGNIDTNKIEVDERKYMALDNAGNRTFWAEQQQLFGGRDATAWQANADSVINVDGVNIGISAGDNVYALAAKINDSGAAVRASIDPVTQGLNLETTDARQLWLSDLRGNALSELGLIKAGAQKPPYNIGNGVRVSGGSMFDTVIALRDALLKGDTENIGGRVLGAIDAGIANLSARIARSGAEYARAQLNAQRNSSTALNVTKQISREGDLDITKAVTDMKMLDYTYQATLNNAGKMYNNNLLNYMR